MTQVAPKFKTNEPIVYKWTLKSFESHDEGVYPATHSTSFINPLIPDVQFQIFCRMTEDCKLTIVVSKVPSTPANATITIRINGQEKKSVPLDNWTDHCIISDISDDILRAPSPGMFPRAENCTFECVIMWGYIEDFYPTSFDLHRHMQRFLTAPDFNDAVIKIGDAEIPVHKVILAAYSPVFSAKLKTQAENQIIVDDVQLGIMQNIIEFMYSGHINSELQVDDLLSILHAAEKYKIVDLDQYCVRMIISKMTVSNVIEILEKADMYQASKFIKRGASSFMIKNKDVMTKSKDFLDLYYIKPELFLDFILEK